MLTLRVRHRREPRPGGSRLLPARQYSRLRADRGGEAVAAPSGLLRCPEVDRGRRVRRVGELQRLASAGGVGQGAGRLCPAEGGPGSVLAARPLLPVDPGRGPDHGAASALGSGPSVQLTAPARHVLTVRGGSLPNHRCLYPAGTAGAGRADAGPAAGEAGRAAASHHTARVR